MTMRKRRTEEAEAETDSKMETVKKLRQRKNNVSKRRK